jgi:hypothetical protein
MSEHTRIGDVLALAGSVLCFVAVLRDLARSRRQGRWPYDCPPPAIPPEHELAEDVRQGDALGRELVRWLRTRADNTEREA